MKRTGCLLAMFWLGVLSAEEVLIAPREAAPQEKASASRELSRLAEGLRELDPEKFRTAAEKLAATGNPQALKYLQQVYPQVDGVRRRLVMQSLAVIRPQELADSMYAMSVSEPFLGLRRACADALVQTLGREAAAKRYLDALRAPEAALSALGRQRALQLLAHVGGKNSAANVRGFLSDVDTNVVCAACEALAVMHDQDAVPALVKLAGLRNAETAPAAQEALGCITGQGFGSNLVQWQQWLQERRPDEKAKVDAYDEGGQYVPDYGRPYEIPLADSAVDFVIVYDTTGSLGRIWPDVSGPIDAVLGEMAKRCHSLRLGTVRYRSDSKERSRYAIQPLPLTRDFQKARDNILDASFGGGSGGLHLGLLHAISAFQWRAHARKMLLIVGDVTPKDEGFKQCLQVIYEARELDQIYFNTLFIRSLHGDEHRPAYVKLAIAGAGRFYEFDRGPRFWVDRSDGSAAAKTAESSLDTLKKWMTPFVRPHE